MPIRLKNIIPALISLILVLLAFAAGWIQGQINGYGNKDCTAKPEFKIYTSAVCDKNPESTECKDKIFVKCGSTEHIINLVNATGRFSNNWKDSRSS